MLGVDLELNSVRWSGKEINLLPSRSAGVVRLQSQKRKDADTMPNRNHAIKNNRRKYIGIT